MTAPQATDAYLLDTNIVSDLVRRPNGRVAGHVARVGEDRVCTSIVVAAELRFGAARSGSRRLRTRVDAVLSVLKVLPLVAPADRQYAEIGAALQKLGRTIGPNDMLIAAHTRALGCVVVTANESEFRRVPKLQVENWLQPAPQTSSGGAP